MGDFPASYVIVETQRVGLIQPSEVSILARRRDALLKEVDDFTRQDGHDGWARGNVRIAFWLLLLFC